MHHVHFSNLSPVIIHNHWSSGLKTELFFMRKPEDGGKKRTEELKMCGKWMIFVVWRATFF
jgi:hypothetical protein